MDDTATMGDALAEFKLDRAAILMISGGSIILLSLLFLLGSHGLTPLLVGAGGVVALTSLLFGLGNIEKVDTEKRLNIFKVTSTVALAIAPPLLTLILLGYHWEEWWGVLVGGIIDVAFFSLIVKQTGGYRGEVLSGFYYGAWVAITLLAIALSALFVPKGFLYYKTDTPRYTLSAEFHLPWEHAQPLTRPKLTGVIHSSFASWDDGRIQIVYTISHPEELSSQEWTTYFGMQYAGYIPPESAIDAKDPAGAVLEDFSQRYPFLEAYAEVRRSTVWSAATQK